jgi:hypothetical protein|tara:strand:- start:161 stop:364 length:204 start_codon:yes stop_codon:yes gene_type:complete
LAGRPTHAILAGVRIPTVDAFFGAVAVVQTRRVIGKATSANAGRCGTRCGVKVKRKLGGGGTSQRKK